MPAPALSSNGLRQQLAGLPTPASATAQVQKAFIEALLTRSEAKTGIARQHLLARAAAALARYASPDQPAAREAAAADTTSNTRTENLSTLLELLNHDQHDDQRTPEQLPLDELMQRMEQEIIPLPPPRTLPGNTASAPKSRRRKKNAPPPPPQGPELQASRQARKSMALDKARKLVDEMHSRQPENPGPLNPQMLATRAITLMRDLSPAYLNRFLTLMDTLFWLETSAEREEARKNRQG